MAAVVDRSVIIALPFDDAMQENFRQAIFRCANGDQSVKLGRRLCRPCRMAALAQKSRDHSQN